MKSSEVMDAINSMKAAVSEIEKKYTMQTGEKIDGDNDGNTGNTTNGEEDFSTFDNLAKKQILKQKMLTGN